ncbi:replicative helicase loader/inhibitor [Caldifermentibacillus hisashii]|uniref:Replicative helicase loader/inhibitor n=1 Tax=Caldifermentibacillus hisashii TaxID=996558 RepID=A0ABU9K3P3_9BACI
MTRDEVKEIFKFIKYIYPNFEVSSEKIDIWTELLADQDFSTVMKKARKHSLGHKYPPSIAELRVYEAPENNFLKKRQQWLKEGAERIANQRNDVHG